MDHRVLSAFFAQNPVWVALWVLPDLWTVGEARNGFFCNSVATNVNKEIPQKMQKVPNILGYSEPFGADGGNRTHNLLITSEMLYH